MNIVFGSHTSMLSPLQVGSHHLARALHAEGHKVVHLSAPMSPLHLLKFRDPMVRSRMRRPVVHLGQDVVEVTPWLPLPARVLDWFPRLGRLLHRLALPPLRRTLRRLGCWPVDLLLIDYPYYVGLRQRLAPRRTAYRATDVYPLLLDRPRLTGVERVLLREVNSVVATSEPVARHLSSLGPSRPIAVVPNGADWPERGPSPERTPGPVAVYVGAIDNRLDADLVTQLAAANPSFEFELVGTVAPQAAQRQWPPNVRLVPPVPHERLPEVLSAARVGLLPLSAHPGNRGRSPIKLFEYVAAGLPVLASGTEEVRRLKLPGVFTYTTADEAAEAFTRAVEAPRPTFDELRARRSQLSWAARANALLEAVA